MLSTSFREHINSIRINNRTSSNYAQHILEINHTNGRTENTVDKLHITNKGKHMNTTDKFHILHPHQQNQQLNDNNTVTKPRLFETVLTQS